MKLKENLNSVKSQILLHCMSSINCGMLGTACVCVVCVGGGVGGGRIRVGGRQAQL